VSTERPAVASPLRNGGSAILVSMCT